MMKKEVCRNFQRGFCKFGDKCKFLHANPQQPRPNPFGFGSQAGSSSFQQTNTNQPQNPNNPFGFGVQTSTPSTGARQTNQFKPFENKWVRNSSAAGTSKPSSQQQANQSQAANHQCTDPQSCKRIIAEDLEHENPLWKLTCYGHYKYMPCDITGDTSYEELRAAAYDEAKRGMNFQSIVERERILLNSKLSEFQNLLQKPYMAQANPAPFTGAPSLPASTSIPSPTMQHPSPPMVSSFSQLGPSLNTGLDTRPPVLSNNAFQFQNSSQPARTPGAFGVAVTPSGPSASNVFAPTGGNSFSVNSLNFNNNGTNNQGSMFSPSIPESQFTNSVVSQPNMLLNGPSASPQFINSAVGQPSMLFNGPSTSPQFTNSAVGQPSALLNGASHTINGQEPALVKPLESVQKVFSGDAAIWSKEKWDPGEIPEEAPPDEFIW